MLNYLENLLAKIRERRAVYSTRILSGSFSDFIEYKFIAGKHQAFEEFEELVKKVYKDMYEGKKEDSDERHAWKQGT